MRTLLWQETFKLLKKKSTYWVTIFLVISGLGQAFLEKLYPHNKVLTAPMAFSSSFAATTWLIFIMIAACATVLSMEFQYGTVKEIIYRQYSRSTILMSKWLVMLGYSIYLYVMTGAVALLGKVLFVNDQFSLTAIDPYSNHLTFLQQWLASMSSSFITLWLVLSVVFLFATLFRSATMAVTAGIVAFFAFNAVSVLMFKLITKFNWVKWNPFNFLNFSNQITDPARHALTQLSDTQLLIGSLAYTALFLAIGLVSFRRQNM